ncbi:MAG: response regulator, partial [Arenimonas sp.]|nr:response regulator [Arenimonas sp.]
SKLPPDQHEFLRTAYTSSRQMLRIVDDILDYSKLEANKLQLESTSFNLRDLLNSIVQLMEKSAEAKGLRLNLQLDQTVRLAMRGDPVRLRQVLTNLISNALKFTERGAVTLVVTRKGETKTQHELRFEVRDTGIGISKDNIANLFRAFAQADASTTRLYGGTGLGLVICKRIVDLMGGSIGVESEVGRGATFWFEVPLLKAAGDMQGQRIDLNGSRVLLLSNDPALRQRMKQAAPSWGAQLGESETMQDALAHLRNGTVRGSTWAISLLLVDLNSVRNTAVALHRNLRRGSEFAGLPVVYLKGTDLPPDELSEGNRVLVLSRNMGSAELRTAISTFIATPTTAGGTTIPPEAFAEDPASADPIASAGKLRGRALLVEDNPINQKVAQSLIRMLGMECETADNGEIAVKRMKAGDLDLVLMDCQMPVMDGYTATREWRQHETANGLSPLPIIAMTANAMAGDRQKCLDSGMDDYLSKPVDRRLLETCLGLWLQRSPQQGTVAAVTGAKGPMAPLAAAFKRAGFPAGTMAPPAPAAATVPVLEMEVIEELRAIMGAEYQGLIKLFLEDAPLHIERLQAAADARDIPGMVAPAHTLKSSSANLGALALSAVAKRIEHSARAESLNKPSQAVLMLANEFRRAKAALLALNNG